MKMIRMKKTFYIVFVLGIALSFVFTFYTQDLSKGAGATITGYGLPLPWLERITLIVPDSPSSYSLYWSGIGLLADICFWTVLIGIVVKIYYQFKK